MKVLRIKDLPCFVQPDGKLPQAVGEKVRDTIKSLIGKKIYITIEEYSPDDKCSLNYMRYYRGVLLPAYRKFRAQEGDPMSIPKCHECILSEFGEYTEYKGLDGIVRLLPKRSRSGDDHLDDKEFHNMCTALSATLSQMGVILPAPPWQQPN